MLDKIKLAIILRLFINTAGMVFVTFSYLIGIYMVLMMLSMLGFMEGLMIFYLPIAVSVVTLWFFWKLIHTDFSETVLDLAEIIMRRVKREWKTTSR